MRRLLLIAPLLCSLLAAAAPESPASPRLAVIVHPERTTSLTVQDLRRIYLMQRRFWDDGAVILPINREPGSAAREAFSRRVLGTASALLASYWNERFFEGTFPPATLSSDAAVKRYVATERGAIGYVDADNVGSSVRVLLELP